MGDNRLNWFLQNFRGICMDFFQNFAEFHGFDESDGGNGLNMRVMVRMQYSEEL